MSAPVARIRLVIPLLLMSALSAPGATSAVPDSRRAAQPGLTPIELGDGRVIYTHGPDAAVADRGRAAGARGRSGGSAPYSCTKRGSFRFVAVLARPFDKAARPTVVVPNVQRAVADASALVDAVAARTPGAHARLRVGCTPGGAVAVEQVVLPTSRSADSPVTVFRDLAAAGLNDSREKYLVFYDDAVGDSVEPCYGGHASIEMDERPSITNANNHGPSWAITYGSSEDCPLYQRDGPPLRTWLHELSHTLGAVQLGAPHTNGMWHCNDGQDVMCGAELGATGLYTPTRCESSFEYDCGGDDYFHPAPPPGSYLAAHWNIAAGYVRYIDRSPH